MTGLYRLILVAAAAFGVAPQEVKDHTRGTAIPGIGVSEALEDAAKAVGAGVTTGAVAVGTGVASAADVVTRPFRSVDLDGDGTAVPRSF